MSLKTCTASLVLCVSIAGCASSPRAPVAVSISPQSALVGSGQTLQFTATVTNDTSGVAWSVSGSSGSIDSQGNYTAPAVTQNSTATITATSLKDPTKTSSAAVTIIASGVVSATANPQVAQYTITVPDGVSVFVQFSEDTSYNLFTWSVAAPAGGGSVPILVAGMKGNTAYHMRAVFQPTGTTTAVFTDADRMFTTSAYPAANLPTLTVATSSGQTPQSGIELLDLVSGPPGRFASVVTDLSGNVLWGYDPGTAVPSGSYPNPIKLLPNGHFIIVYTFGPNGTTETSLIQEVDLAGQVIWELTPAQLNAKLAAATCSGCNINVVGNHHDVAILPNGHLIVLASLKRILTVSGFSSPLTVTGDVIIDLDQNRNPVWLWNSFDWLDVNRHPMLFPDWTHSNAVVYSPDDKGLMLSIRHQAWVIKINYNDGTGDGSILWKLGYQGDFNLLPGATNAADPADWFTAQHDSNFISSTTAGTFDVLLFDNGNQRVLDTSGTLCGPTTSPCESRVPIFHLDDSAKTADITWIDKLTPVFSFFGGSARQLANGNIELDECATPTSSASIHASVYEVTKTTPSEIVWQMQVTGQYAYRAIRIPSLYPGVQW
jgi:arylsulfate sulfotransferase